MEDDYGADENLLAAMAASTSDQPSRRPIQQPTPQRLDKAPPSTTAASSGSSKIVQPTPQALPQKPQSGSTILVSPRQRGNPVLTCFKTLPWEYSDIPADYVMGLTTCALFLSLKYHRLHPEYIYTRIRNLQGKYNLRILLTMVDIPNHEDPLRELAKTSLVNNVTIILCWSAAEAAHYLELYKTNENASFTAIKGQQSSNYADRLVDFVTTPRSLNKSDAVALVANFGSLKNAINADTEALSMINGWGGVKVKRWIAAVEEPFRTRNAAKRGVDRTANPTAAGTAGQDKLDKALPLSRVPLRDMPSKISGSGGNQPQGGKNTNRPAQFHLVGDGESDDDEDDEDDEAAMMAAAIEESKRTSQTKTQNDTPGTGASTSNNGSLSDGVAAALAKLRQDG